MTIKEIMKELAFSDSIPENAIKEAINKKDEITPYFLKILENSIVNIEKINNGNYDDNDEEVFAMLFLAYFKEKCAYPLLISCLPKIKTDPYELMGDFLFQSLPKVIASVYNGDLMSLINVIENPEVDKNIRMAFISAFEILTLWDYIDRKEAEVYFMSFIERFKVPEDRDYIEFIAMACYDLGFIDSYSGLRDLYKDGYIDEAMMSIREFDEHFKRTSQKITEETRTRNKLYHFVDDIIDEVSWWSHYNDEFDDDYEDDELLDEDEYNPGYYQDEDTETIFRYSTKIGRNDPCPCGSGKKFKRCCGEWS